MNYESHPIFYLFSIKILIKVLDILQAVWYYIIRKEDNTLSKKHCKKKSGNQTDRLTSNINLISAILNLVTVILIVLEKLLE